MSLASLTSKAMTLLASAAQAPLEAYYVPAEKLALDLLHNHSEVIALNRCAQLHYRWSSACS